MFSWLFCSILWNIIFMNYPSLIYDEIVGKNKKIIKIVPWREVHFLVNIVSFSILKKSASFFTVKPLKPACVINRNILNISSTKQSFRKRKIGNPYFPPCHPWSNYLPKNYTFKKKCHVYSKNVIIINGTKKLCIH